ncbi:negative regulator of sigma-X activity [Neobacillus bataviensis]|uniref:negative regulator of sigma-X activity n=1 Tax=Neobacillus bataviensis TaxID=220685 RepID=UPI001CBCAD06|nr:negative regulator of sigma-X activity [Neobacillus bataviensis]
MRKSEWSDKQLEELIRQMPKIQDHRDPRDIYQNLSIKKRKLIPWLLPGIATAAAVLLFLILVPNLMDRTNNSFNQAQEKKSLEQTTANKDAGIAMDKEEATSKEGANSGTKEVKLLRTESVKSAIYDDEVGNGKVLTYWIPDQQAQILIPVSTIVSDTGNKSWLTVFAENMASLKEEEWGLSDFYPLNATLELDKNNNSVIVDVPSNHLYGQGSTNETSFINVLQKDIASNSNLRKIEFKTNGEPGIELGNYGTKQEQNIVIDKNHAFLFYYPAGSKLPYLTPTNNTYKDFGTALEAMRADQPENGLKSSLSPSLQIYDVTISDKTLSLSLKDDSTLKDNQLTLYSFEALMLTAKEFGVEKIIVKNSPLTHIGPFDLSKENKVPIAPNLRNIQ